MRRGLPRRFDPAVYRLVQFDQRGCGKSTPHAGVWSTNLAIVAFAAAFSWWVGFGAFFAIYFPATLEEFESSVTEGGVNALSSFFATGVFPKKA